MPIQRVGGPEPSEGPYCCRWLSCLPELSDPPSILCLRLSIHPPSPVVPLGLVTALGAHSQAHSRGTIATG